MADPEQRHETLPNGVRRQLPPVAEDFSVGQEVSDGMVQRWILSLHGDSFEDHDRIDGAFILLMVRVAKIPESEWEIREEDAEAFASRQTPFPPVVLDSALSFIDGGHRHRAAVIRGDTWMLAFVPVSIALSLISAGIAAPFSAPPCSDSISST